MTLAPADMICFALYSATHAMQQAYRPHLDRLGLTYPQYLVLSALWTADTPPRMGDVARQLQLESNTLTPLLKRLEAAGLLIRRRDPEDERQVRLDLTEAGQQMRARAAHVPGCIADEAGLPLDDLLRLRDEITTLRDQLRKA
ncbi:MarR family winged helix-turn-helix transcriptional regulator [Salipiger marinus]|jgi:MarR family transcriptional regulator, organic hydroperoxide resistance regulator|uniref:MarR family protein n=1 Tax=Salipiger marinus TaxID=555512 RepID=A0A1G8RQY5_9RHOB|nr:MULTISPECIES: MarR family transcriptional regulator [Salipiger]MCD1620327.1 MarR family transcriptional regulator [Salipiger manganoxidans]MEB3421021.1 MarR family transcriptional regulator [Salipiger manganoxidans]SDJ19377.1 MarR family protein [Salipiger marinus]HBM60155.1 MarR family transcriptional regulator [Citreicella sp.]